MNGLVIPADVKVSIFHEKEEPFSEAAFYDSGTIAMVEHGERRILIDVAGDVRLYAIATGDEIWTTDQMRYAFPDGNIDNLSDDWDVQEDRWYEMHCELDGHSLWCIDEVLHDYNEALQAAIDALFNDEVWD